MQKGCLSHATLLHTHKQAVVDPHLSLSLYNINLLFLPFSCFRNTDHFEGANDSLDI